MKFNQRLTAVLVCMLAVCLLTFSFETLEAQAFEHNYTSSPSQIPTNPRLSLEISHPEMAFGEFAWQTFVALNSPTSCDGSPLTDSDDSLYQETAEGEQEPAIKSKSKLPPRSWEFYNYPEEIFLDDGQNPGKLTPVVPPQCQNPSTKNTKNWLLGMRLTEESTEDSGIDPDEIKQNTGDFVSIKLPDRGVLVDQSGNYVLNEIRLNPIEVEQILANGWYSADNLKPYNNKLYGERANPFALVCSFDDRGNNQYVDSFPCLENENVGSIEIKAAWKVFPSISAGLNSGYYTTTRKLYVDEKHSTDGTKQVTVPVGLVGFHIIHKTSNKAWVWSTFEHVGNAPNNYDVEHDLPLDSHYNLYNPDCQENCETNTPYAKKPYLWDDQFAHAVTRDKDTGNIIPQIPSQITRLIPITPTAADLNRKWQEKFTEDPIWQNYQLIGVQWLKNPATPYSLNAALIQPTQGGSTPSLLANVTLEPYVQTDWFKNKKVKGSSCAACHMSATLAKPNNKTHADFSFLLRSIPI